uniref:Uncharacterized protein n=1 Tax=Fagus sylvatica TaxID=28930 RepID=A0A2N9I8Z2_FAGSY
MDSQARSDYPIAIRLSVKSQFVPDRLDEFQARSDYPIAIRLSVKSQFVPDRLITNCDSCQIPMSLIVWMNSQARSDYPIAIRLSVKSQFVPDRLDEFQARSDYPIAIRLSVKSQFVPDRLDDSQARSDYPIAIRLSVKSQFVPDRLDGFQARSDYPIAIRLSVKSQFVPDRLDEFQARSDYPIAIRLSVKSQFVPDRLDEFQARSDYPIAIRLSVKSQFVPDRLDEFQARSDYPIAIRLSVKSQFVPDRLDDSQARSDYPIAIRLSVKSQFVPDRLDEFPSQAKTARQSESRIARYEQKSREGEVGSREEKGRKSDGMRAKGRAASFKVGPRAPSSRAARDDHAPVSTSAPNGPFEPPITSPHLVRSFSTFGMSIWTLGGTGTQTETNCAATETPNKEGATVITPFLPTGIFSRCRHAKWRGDPDPARMIQRSLVASNTPKEEGPGHISQERNESFDSDTLRVENGRETRKLWSKLRKNGPTLSQILLSVVDKTAYLGGNVCAKILSDPLQLGPRAKTLRQEVHFSYHMQLSDHQELLRSSRNLSQKMTPWHKEHSNGLRSQDHILRTQARLCARPVPLENRVFLTRNKLIHKPGCVGKKTHSCTTWNSRIAKILSGQAGILIGKLPSNGPKTLRWPLFAEPYLTSPSSDFRKSGTLQKFERKTRWEENAFFLPDSRLRAQSLSGSQQVDLRARVRWKDNDSSYVVELSVRRKHPPFDRNLHRKRCTKTAPIPRLPGAITLSSELRFSKLYTVGKRTSRAFRRYAA